MLTKKLKRNMLLATVSGAFLALAPISTAYAQCADFPDDLDALGPLITAACENSDMFGDEDGNWLASGCEIWSELEAAGIPMSGQSVWNALANNGSLTIGPRIIVDGIRADGNLVQGTKKTYILQDIIDDDFEIDINFEKGKADLEVSVCHIDENGNKEVVANFFDESQSGLNPTVSVDDNGMYAVLLKARSTGTGVQRYKYNITVDVNNQSAPPRDKPRYGRIDPSKVGTKRN